MQEYIYDFGEWISKINSKFFNSISCNDGPRNVIFDPTKLKEITMPRQESSFSKPFIYSIDYIKANQKQIISILARLLGLTISAATTYFLMKWLMKNLDPTNSDKQAAKNRAEKIIKLVGMSDLDLNEHELFIASNLILPQDIDCSWSDIGGLDHIIDDLRLSVIYPLKNLDNFSNSNPSINRRSKLVQAPKGVLLFGVIFCKGFVLFFNLFT